MGARLKDLPHGEEPSKEEFREMYLQLMSNSVLGLSLPNSEYSFVEYDLGSLMATRLSEEMRRNGTDYPFIGISASGEKNLQRLRSVLESKYRDLKSGDADVVSCAPFRGGTAVFMRAVLHSMGVYQHARVLILGPLEPPTSKNPEYHDLPTYPHEQELESRADRALEVSPLKMSRPPATIDLGSYMRLQSSSQFEVKNNIHSHFPIVPNENEIRIIDMDSCEDAASCAIDRKVAVLHIGPAGAQEAAQCMSIVRPMLAPGAVVIADRCWSDVSNCKEAFKSSGLEPLLEGPVEALESGGGMGTVKPSPEGQKTAGAASVKSFGIAMMQDSYVLLLKVNKYLLNRNRDLKSSCTFFLLLMNIRTGVKEV